MRSIGLDIGEYSVKLVELIQHKKIVTINQIQERQLSQNVSVEDKELEVIEFVRNFLTSADYSQARWILALRQDQVTTRFKSFPFSDRSKIQKSLSFEMEEDIPFDTDSCIFDAKIIHTQGLSADVLSTAAPKSHIEKIISLAADFGIEVHIVTVEGLAYANLVEEWYDAPPESAEPISINQTDSSVKNLQIVLNIGHKKTLFTAFENNRLIFTRSLFWGANQLILEIIKKHAISYVEATHILHTQAGIVLNKEGVSFEQAQLSDLLSKNLLELIRDLQMTIIELQSQFNANITAVHFTGGASRINNLSGFLTQHLEVACNPIYLLQNYVGSMSSLSSPEQAHDVEARFTTAVAVGIEGFKKSINPPTNLLKGIFAKQHDGLKVLWGKWGNLVQIGATAMLVLFVWSAFRLSFSSVLAEKVDEAIITQAKGVAKLPKKQANEAGVKKYLKENKKKISELKQIAQVAQINSALDILKKVSEASPSKDLVKVDIMTFTVKDDVVQISGYAQSATEISALAQSLKSISTDNVVSSTPSQLTPVSNKTAFNISFKTDRGLIK